MKTRRRQENIEYENIERSKSSFTQSYYCQNFQLSIKRAPRGGKMEISQLSDFAQRGELSQWGSGWASHSFVYWHAAASALAISAKINLHVPCQQHCPITRARHFPVLQVPQIICFPAIKLITSTCRGIKKWIGHRESRSARDTLAERQIRDSRQHGTRAKKWDSNEVDWKKAYLND